MEEISIFYAGNTISLTKKEEIHPYISSWNEIYRKKWKSYQGSVGFTFIVDVRGKDGSTTRFVINSENTVARGGYFHKTTAKEIEFDQILRLFDHFYV